MFATSSSWKLLFLFSPSPYHFLGWWPTKLLLSSPCVMPVTLNRTQCHSNNSFAFAPGAVEVIDLNLNSKGLTATLFLMSCLFCGSLFLWGNPPQEVRLVPSLWVSPRAMLHLMLWGATQSSVFLKSFQVISRTAKVENQGQLRWLVFKPSCTLHHPRNN